MKKKSYEEEEREIILEKYSFRTAKGILYNIKPPLIGEIMDGSFFDKINKTGIPKDDDDIRIEYILLLADENRKGALSELISDYVTDYYGNKTTLEEMGEKGAGIDDIHVLIKRIIGVSGQ